MNTGLDWYGKGAEHDLADYGTTGLGRVAVFEDEIGVAIIVSIL
ncbi:MAG: hypothetical protein ACXVAY_18585 [Mucilaginibacter sp.]